MLSRIAGSGCRECVGPSEALVMHHQHDAEQTPSMISEIRHETWQHVQVHQGALQIHTAASPSELCQQRVIEQEVQARLSDMICKQCEAVPGHTSSVPDTHIGPE